MTGNRFYLSFFKDIPEITSYNYFLFDNKYLGKLKLKKCPNDEQSTIVLLKNEHKRFTGSIIKMPKILKPLGIEQDRREYLNKKISPLVLEQKNLSHYALKTLR